MALTALEQLQLVNGEGNYSPQGTDLMTLVKVTAYIKATDFYDNYREFDKGANPEAAEYLRKMFAVCDAVYRGRLRNELFNIVITIIGRDVNSNAFNNVIPDSTWEDFISDRIRKWAVLKKMKHQLIKLYK